MYAVAARSVSSLLVHRMFILLTSREPSPIAALPTIAEPSWSIAMDIVGPLPKSRLVSSTSQIFARLVIPEEILPDQGRNCMSTLQSEVYKLMKI